MVIDKFKNYEDLFADASGQEDDSDELFLTEQESEMVEIGKKEDESLEKWKILIVDDEEDIHHVTRIALKGFTFRGKPVVFFDAYSAAEAEKILKKHPDIALILLDVVMETTNAGLDLVKIIRDKLGNKVTQIIIRTGQPGQAPERDVIVSYEINDYKTKTELTSLKLFTVALASLRAYEAVQQIGRLNEEFKLEINRHIRKEKILEHAREKAEKSEQQKSVFLHQMSEKVQGPLNLILDSSDTIRKEVKDQVNDNIRQLFDDMSYSGKEIIRAVQMIKDLSEIQADNYEVNLEKISVSDAISDILADEKYAIHKSGIDLVVENKASSDIILIDEYAFGQILSNVIDNAVKNTREGLIEIEVSQDNDKFLKISVSDTGRGMSQSFQKEMFLPFKRELSNDANGHGLGLGLTLTKEFCKLMNVIIHITSKPGKGTRVYLSIPLRK
ncbi:MAG: hybrid sensor histidine kinase/response regulator [Bacteroidales bacterium]|nr:hybrid sensor histidine kinase/response regulator [Bacteroidales bacterium]